MPLFSRSLSNAMNENWRGANRTSLNVTKGLIQLHSSIPEWMTLFPDFFPTCAILTCVTVFLSQRWLKTYPRSTIIIIIIIMFISLLRWDRVEWLTSFSFVLSALGYGIRVVLNSMDKITETFVQRHGINNYFFSVQLVSTYRNWIECYRVREVLEIYFCNWNS